jgi:hypothetical protein
VAPSAATVGVIGGIAAGAASAAGGALPATGRGSIFHAISNAGMPPAAGAGAAGSSFTIGPAPPTPLQHAASSGGLSSGAPNGSDSSLSALDASPALSVAGSDGPQRIVLIADPHPPREHVDSPLEAIAEASEGAGDATSSPIPSPNGVGGFGSGGAESSAGAALPVLPARRASLHGTPGLDHHSHRYGRAESASQASSSPESHGRLPHYYGHDHDAAASAGTGATYVLPPAAAEGGHPSAGVLHSRVQAAFAAQVAEEASRNDAAAAERET